MTEQMQAILLKVILTLKRDQWAVADDWELTLKSEGHVPLSKHITVEGNLDDEEWNDQVDVSIDLKMASDDELTYFPEYTIYANILIAGGESKDIAYKTSVDVAFTANDIKDDSKSTLAARKISRSVEEHIETEYSDYVDQNAQAIKDYKAGGYGGDVDPER